MPQVILMVPNPFQLSKNDLNTPMIRFFEIKKGRIPVKIDFQENL